MFRRIVFTLTLSCLAFTGKAQPSIDSIINPASLKQIVATLAADSFRRPVLPFPE
jgi:hypothetical protein